MVGSFSDNNVTGISSIKGNALTGTNGTYNASMDNSFAGFKGISQVNQAAGSINNQWNSISVCSSPGQISRIGQSYKSEIKDNYLKTSGNCYTASITGESFAGGVGIVQVNQVAGNMNSQYNGLSLNIGAAGPKGAVYLTDSELSTAKTNNTIICDPNKPNNYNRPELTTDPADNFKGLWGSNQVAGDLNSVKTIFTINVTTVP